MGNTKPANYPVPDSAFSFHTASLSFAGRIITKNQNDGLKAFPAWDIDQHVPAHAGFGLLPDHTKPDF